MLGNKRVNRNGKTASSSIALVFFMLALTSGLAITGLSINCVTAQTTPYQVTGQIRATDAIWHFIYGVHSGDLVLVSVSPDTTNPYYWSSVYGPNTAVIQSQGGSLGTGGSHSYEFFANASGNYLLRFWTANAGYSNGAGFNYTIKSSHQVSAATPPASTLYSISGAVADMGTSYQTLFSVKTGDLILVSVSPSGSDPYYWSSLYSPNMTVIQSQGGSLGASGPHPYQIIANASGNYLLKFWTAKIGYSNGAGFNYTIRSSVPLVAGQTPMPSSTATPSPSASTPQSPTLPPTVLPTQIPTSAQTPTNTPTVTPTSTGTSSPTNPGGTDTSGPTSTGSQGLPTSTASPTSYGTDSRTPTPTTHPTQTPMPSSSTSSFSPEGSNSTQPADNSFSISNYAIPIAALIIVVAIIVSGVALSAHNRKKRKHDDEDLGMANQKITLSSWNHIFISHAEEDAKIAEEIAAGLEAAGHKTWYYERDSIPGPSFILTTSKAIEQSKAVILIISRDSIRSYEVHTEVMTTHDARKPFIPVLNGISYSEFQQSQPEWRRILGTSTSITIARQGVHAIIPRIIAGINEVKTLETNQDINKQR